jgi:hypothetical protein
MTPTTASQFVVHAAHTPDRGPSSGMTKSVLSTAQAEKFRAFRVKQYYMIVSGSYAIICPFLAEKFPAIADQLRIDINFLPSSTVEYGIMEAHVDLGLFRGTAAMGVDDKRLAGWCALQHYQSRTEWRNGTSTGEDCETKRMRVAFDDAWKRLGCVQSRNGTPIIPQIETMTESPPYFFCDFRFYDDRRLFMKPGFIFADSGSISFTDATGLQFNGALNLPMLSEKPIFFQGFKVGAAAATPAMQPWGAYDTSRIRYGPIWREN